MKCDLTDKQKELARWIVEAIRNRGLPESFIADIGFGTYHDLEYTKGFQGPTTDIGMFQCLEREGLLVRNENMITVTGKIFSAVDGNFADQAGSPVISALAQPHPPEIAMSLDRLRMKYSDPKKLGFLVMRFTAAKPFARIVEVIKQTAAKYDITIVRADENEFHADLWGNVRTHLHGCGFGIAVYERIETEEPNANVGLEVGYLMAMSKPVLLLKDKTVATLQSDLAGKLYRPFDPHDPETTIPGQLTKWLEDNGIIIPNRQVGST